MVEKTAISQVAPSVERRLTFKGNPEMRLCSFQYAIGQLTRFVVIGCLFLGVSSWLAAPVNAGPFDDERLGIVTEQPAEGRYVELPDGRFMVPFSMTIPGTEVEFEMVPIPGGTFLLGSPEDEAGRNGDEGPQVEVAIEPFWMGRYEVTWAEYTAYMELDELFKYFNTNNIREVTEERKIDAVTAPSGLYDPSFTYEAGDGPNQPAATMSQFAAKQYTKWLSLLTGDFFRLPSEAEWEYACRAGTTTAYHFGDDPELLHEYAWFIDNADWQRRDVGQKKPNPWGLYDMYGNVAEWVLDGYDPEGYGGLELGEGGQPAVNWPDELFPRVVRGGSFEMEAATCRSAARLPSDDDDWRMADPNYPQSPWWFTTEPATGVGFRLVRPLHVPATREGKERYWTADHPLIEGDVRQRIEDYGKGAWGLVDPELPGAIERAREDR